MTDREREALAWLHDMTGMTTAPRDWRPHAREIQRMLGERDHGPMVNKTEWVVTWTRIGRTGVIDGLSTLSSWPAVVDYIERIVPQGATFTVKPA